MLRPSKGFSTHLRDHKMPRPPDPNWVTSSISNLRRDRTISLLNFISSVKEDMFNQDLFVHLSVCIINPTVVAGF